MFYDKQGKSVELMEFAELCEDREYRRVDLTDLSGERSVSTIWLGLDQNIIDSPPPLIFETALLETGEFVEIYGRTDTLEHAKEMHDEAVEHYEKS